MRLSLWLLLSVGCSKLLVVSENQDLEAQLAAARAEAAEAEAAAAKAKAEAAAARLAALEAQANSAEKCSSDAEPAQQEAPAEAPSPAQPAQDVSEFALQIAAAYEFDGASIPFGTLLEDGKQVPGVNAKIPLATLNRHMLVAGATGSGKTRTLQLLAEGLSAAGTPTVLVDVKGDLTGLAVPGSSSEKLLARTSANGQAWAPAQFPVELLTPAGADAPVPGAFVRTRISSFGPLLLARALGLNSTQEQALQLIFSWADKNGLELVDLGDLRSVVAFLTSPEGKSELATLGGVGPATAGVIQRALTALESQGADKFFGEPSFETAQFLRTAPDGKGVISLLEVGDMSSRPALISALIMWLLAELFQDLPEVGDLEQPKLAFVFDEAHLLFTDATKEFVRQVVHTVRLIRSKGVSVIFVTQTPNDIPSEVLAQLGGRIQHALRAVTPQDQRNLKEAVKTFPATDLDLAEILTNLGTGEAVITVLGKKDRPTPVAPFSIWAPASVMGAAGSAKIDQLVNSSQLYARFKDPVDPRSATEVLAERAEQAKAQAEAAERAAQEAKEAEKAAKEQAKAQAAEEARLRKEAERAQKREQAEKERRARQAESVVTNVLRSAGRTLGREITRSIFGTRRR